MSGQTGAPWLSNLYAELRARHGFWLTEAALKAVVNTRLGDGVLDRYSGNAAATRFLKCRGRYATRKLIREQGHD